MRLYGKIDEYILNYDNLLNLKFDEEKLEWNLDYDSNFFNKE